MSGASPDHTVVLQFTPGEVLDDRWRLETRIGQGAMGMVFKGKDLETNKPCAIKMLAPEHVRKQKVLARFEREADLMVNLRHRNIVQMLGHGRRGLVPYIVMEYLEGKTLAEVLEARGQALPLLETVAIIKGIAAGLAFLHHNELVHRDIKPQNVFLAQGGRVTILDLGVVRDQANPGLTRPGAMVGTPYYMSPEQIQGLEDIDRRTDVYALAAMTFELLTGRPPFLGANNFEVLYGHRNTAVPDASTLGKVPKPVAAVLARGMAKKREERPDTASEFAADLEAASGAAKVDLNETFKKWLAAKPATKKPAAAPRAPEPKAAPEPREAPGPRPAAPAEQHLSAERTRIVQRPAELEPAGPSGETPMAADSDVLSLANAIDPTGEGVPTTRLKRTAARPPPPSRAGAATGAQADAPVEPDRTFVGPVPDATTGETATPVSPTGRAGAAPGREAGKREPRRERADEAAPRDGAKREAKREHADEAPRREPRREVADEAAPPREGAKREARRDRERTDEVQAPRTTTSTVASGTDESSGEASSEAARDEGADTSSALEPVPSPPAASAWVQPTGKLTVSTGYRGNPVPATLTIDKKLYGPTPQEVSLLPGAHTVKVEAQGFWTQEKVLETTLNPMNLRLELLKK